MVKGVVKWFNSKKGYGFIEQNNKNGDIFVHISAVKQSGIYIQEGTKLEFDIVIDNGRETAQNLKQIL